MSEATRKFAAIVCAELAGKVDVNDFRFGSTSDSRDPPLPRPELGGGLN